LVDVGGQHPQVAVTVRGGGQDPVYGFPSVAVTSPRRIAPGPRQGVPVSALWIFVSGE
jgi:hypothetical protein